MQTYSVEKKTKLVIFFSEKD